MIPHHGGGGELAFIVENGPAPPLLDALHRTGVLGHLYIGRQ